LAFLGKNRNIIIAAIIVVLVVAGGYVGYTLWFAPQPETEIGIIKIGVITELTGFYTLGQDIKPAMELAVQYINDHGGVKVQGKTYNLTLVIRDDQTSVATGIALASELDEQEQVICLTGSANSDVSIAIMEYARDHGITWVVNQAASPEIRGGQDGWTYRFQPDSVTKGVVAGQWMMDQDPNAKVAIMYGDNAYYGTMGFGVRWGVEHYGSKEQVVYFQGFPLSQVDYTAAAAGIKLLNPDFVWQSGNVNMIRALLQAGFTGRQIIHASTPTSLEMIQALGEEVVGSVGVAQMDFWKTSSEVQGDAVLGDRWEKFWIPFKGIRGEVPNAISMLAYDTIWIIKEAIERADSLDRTKFNEAMAQTSLKGICWPTKTVVFDSEGQNLLGNYISQVTRQINATYVEVRYGGYYDYPEGFIPTLDLALAYPVYPY